MSGLRRALLAAAGALAFVACAHQDYVFVPDPECRNGKLDTALGETDVDCGGPDCRACVAGQRCNSRLDCQRGECLGGKCEDESCENRFKDPGETGIDCGGSCPTKCQPGQPCLIADDCSTGVCDPDELTCATAKCNDGVLNGDESDTDCGGRACDGCLTGETCGDDLDCQSGACEDDVCVVECERGRGDCVIDDGEECETNTLTSVEHCGDCGNECELAHASAVCGSGACQIDECEGSWDDCRGGAEDGCETDLDTNADHCGKCGFQCPEDNGRASCEDGRCELECNDGFEDCDTTPGCEARTNVDTANCGGCDRTCPEDEGEAAYCYEGDCGATDCPDNFGNCDGPRNGSACEDNLLTDPENCGRCGRLCVVQHGSAACVNGECVVARCDAGWDDCIDEDESGGQGCETNTLVSQDNCGGCGISCDAENGEGRCAEGTCRIDGCEDGYENCNIEDEDGGFADGCETNLRRPANCGICGNDCSERFPNAAVTCVDSACVQGECNPGFRDCIAGTGSPGCESELATSEAHCGECGNSCDRSGATENSCEGGSCRVTCDPTHLSCDGNDANGCEEPQGVTRCGDCNTACASGAAVHVMTTACVVEGDTSVCRPDCAAGWGACSNPELGCLTQLNDAANCGSCGAVCTGGETCIAVGGEYRCQSPLTIANNSVNNGGTSPSLTLTHNLQAGQNRVVVVGVAGRSSGANGGSIGQARPDSVRYAGVNMLPAGEFEGPSTTQDGQGHIFYYFLTDTGSARLSGSGSMQVVVDASVAPSPGALAAVVAQFNGANQTTPIVSGASSTARGPTSTSAQVTLVTPGSMIFSLAVAQYSGRITAATGALVNPAPPTPPAQPLMNRQVPGPYNLWWLGAGSTAPLAPGMYNVGWTWEYCDSAVHYAVILQPARKP